MSKITTEHLERCAYVYIRQSTADQLIYNHESRRRQYGLADPAELERRWNDALQTVRRIEVEIAAIVAAKPPPLGERERQQLMQLGADLELAWSHPAATAATRKRVLRTALNEISGAQGGTSHQRGSALEGGGDHTALQVKLRLNAAGRHHWPPPEDTIALVRELARLMPDRQIARLLNRSGKSTGYGNGWTEQRVIQTTASGARNRPTQPIRSVPLRHGHVRLTPRRMHRARLFCSSVDLLIEASYAVAPGLAATVVPVPERIAFGRDGHVEIAGRIPTILAEFHGWAPVRPDSRNIGRALSVGT